MALPPPPPSAPCSTWLIFCRRSCSARAATLPASLLLPLPLPPPAEELEETSSLDLERECCANSLSVVERLGMNLSPPPRHGVVER